MGVAAAAAVKLKPVFAVLGVVVTGQKRNGKSAFELEVVVGGLLSWENPKDCGAFESEELPKGELLTVLLA